MDSEDDLPQTTTTSVAIISHAMTLFTASSSVMRLLLLLMEDLQEEYNGDYSVNPSIPKISRLDNLINGHVSLIKVNTGFFPGELEDFCQVICPVIFSRSRHTHEVRASSAGRKCKLSPRERVLATILYLRGCNGIRAEAVCWNHSRTSLRSDCMFICSIINEVMAAQIAWPTSEQRAVMRNRNPFFPGCLGYVDGTLCKIRRPRSVHHRAYFNGRKKLYCFKNAVVIDHDGLFRFVAAGYAGSFHDISVLRDTDLARNWQQYFAVDHNSPYPVEYLLGDPGYLGLDHFVLRRIDAREVADVDSDPVMRAFNKLHSGYRVKVEWGICGMKMLFKRFLDICPNRRSSFALMFESAAIMTNFLHRRRRDFSISLQQLESSEGEWQG